MKSRLLLVTSLLLILLLTIILAMNIPKLKFDNLTLFDGIKSRILNRVDVDKLYEETPYIFEAGKQLAMHTPLNITEYEEKLNAQTGTMTSIEDALEGDGGIIKNRNATIFPYDFHFELSQYMYTSELNVSAKNSIRVSVLGELKSDNELRDLTFDVILMIDDVSYGVRRFQTGKWGYADWSNIPAGKLTLVLSNPDQREGEQIVGFGAVFTGD